MLKNKKNINKCIKALWLLLNKRLKPTILNKKPRYKMLQLENNNLINQEPNKFLLKNQIIENFIYNNLEKVNNYKIRQFKNYYRLKTEENKCNTKNKTLSKENLIKPFLMLKIS